MFDSYINHKDLIFQDATVRLLPIAPENQTYIAYLGPDFIRRMQRMQSIDCVTGRASLIRLSSVSVLLSMVISFAMIWTA
jgi:melanoma-associated antigen p97